MSNTTIPAVLLALLEQLPPLLPADVNVSLGQPTDNELGMHLFIGVSDPDAGGYQPAVTFSQTWPLATSQAVPLSREENYTVRLAVEAFDGEGDLQSALLAVADVFEIVVNHLRTSRNLGVAGVTFIKPSEDPGSWEFVQANGGALALLVFSVNVTARI